MSIENAPSEKVKPELAQGFYLASNLQLIVHTRATAQLLDGTWQNNRLGLKQFAIMVFRLWQAAKQDDPYADWHLMKIYEALQDKKALLQGYEQASQKRLADLRGLEVGLFVNADPYKYPLTFNTPFGFMGALLLENTDYVHRQLFTLYRLGIVHEITTPAAVRQHVREVFNLPRNWHHTGVTRQDIHDANPKAQKAVKLMGKVPKAVLEREVQLSLLPRPRTTVVQAEEIAVP